MFHTKAQQFSAWSQAANQHNSHTLHTRPFAVAAKPNSSLPLTPEQQENEAFQQNRVEATQLKIQAKYGTLAPEGQERLGVLQAKMNGLLQRRVEQASRFDHNFANIAIAPSKNAPNIEPVKPIQTKLTLGLPGDKYEQEADSVAEQVMRIPDSAIRQPLQREALLEDEEEVQTKPLSASITPLVQRDAMLEEDEEPVQTKSLGNLLQREAIPEEEEEAVQAKPSPTADTQQPTQSLESRLNDSKSAGSPLSDEVRSFMEPRFGFNFSQVRVHTDSKAVQMNRELNAQAFTHGSHIYFGEGKSPAKDNLTAHEMTHVLHQTGGEPQTGGVQSKPADTRQPTLMDSLQRKCAACEAEEQKEDETIQTKAISSSGERVQRSIGGFFNDVTGGLFGNSGNGSETAEFPPCEDVRPTPPSLNSWLDNSALEAIRHNGKVLSQSQSPSGDSQEATRLVKQLLLSWGCEFFSQNLLPKFGTNTTFGTETKTAVQKFQSYFALGSDGVIGEKTLETMDVYMGVSRPSKPMKPSEVGGDDVQGNSTFTTKKNPTAQIYFPTDGNALDKDDVGILFSLANYLEKAKSVSLNFYGYTDKREAADYNLKLADRRAASVSSTLLTMLDDRNMNNYEAGDVALGEIERPQNGETSEELKPFRRVDVEIAAIEWPESDEPEPICDNLLCIPDRPPTEPMADEATKWRAQIVELSSTCVGVIANACVVNGTLEFQMREPGTKGRKLGMQYIYNGEGIAIGPPKFPSLPCAVAFSEASKWVEFDTTEPMKIQDFKGEASHYGAGIALGKALSRDDFEFFGPVENAGADSMKLTWETAIEDDAGENLACPSATQDWGRLKAWTSPRIIWTK